MNKKDLAFPYDGHRGLTKREYIATQILNGILSKTFGKQDEMIVITVQDAIEYTDELLKQLEQTK